MKFLIFDTETTGLPARGARLPRVEMYPYIVQFSWLVFDDATMRITNINNHLIKLPDGMTIPQESINIHGVTNEAMQQSGEDIKLILEMFHQSVKESQIIVAHNIKFDDEIVQSECIRNNMENSMTAYPSKIKYCTMNYGKNITKLQRPSKFNPGQMYFKPPKLFELHKHYFNTIPNNLHNSLVDVFVCFRCFYRMVYDKDLFNPREQSELSHYYNQLTQISN